MPFCATNILVRFPNTTNKTDVTRTHLIHVPEQLQRQDAGKAPDTPTHARANYYVRANLPSNTHGRASRDTQYLYSSLEGIGLCALTFRGF